MKITLISSSASKKLSEEPKKFGKPKKPSLTNWFHKMSKESQEEYLDEHPNSQYAKQAMREIKHAERKARTGKLSEDLDPRFKEASKGLDKNILKEVSKLDEDLQQAFAKKFSGAMEEFNLDLDSEETTESLKSHRARAIKAKKEAENATSSFTKKKAIETFNRERDNYRELKLAQQKAQDIAKTPGKMEKFKNELGRKLLSKMSKVQADTSV